MSRQKEYIISAEIMEQIYYTLMGYADEFTYEAPRIGGVLQGCPRGNPPTPYELTFGARTILKLIEKDVLGRIPSEWLMVKKKEWVICREIVLDDIPGCKPQLGYALTDKLPMFLNHEEAIDTIKELKLPVGWVAMHLSRFIKK